MRNDSARTDSNAPPAVKGGRGGRREGAGRRPSVGDGPKEKFSTRLDPVVVLRIERLSRAYGLSKAGVIEKLVHEANNRLWDEIPRERWAELGI